MNIRSSQYSEYGWLGEKKMFKMSAEFTKFHVLGHRTPCVRYMAFPTTLELSTPFPLCEEYLVDYAYLYSIDTDSLGPFV